MNWIKIISINLMVTFSLLFIVFMSPPIIFKVYAKLVKLQMENVQSNVDLDSTKDLNVKYYDFISWRRDDIHTDQITIVKGERVHPQKAVLSKSETWFFGGSTTFGYGVNDSQTYPAYFSELSSKKVRNFGESGYIARQSLAYFNNILIEEFKLNENVKNIVFFDGVNDVAHRCRSEIFGLGTGRETQIRKKLSSSSTNDDEIFTYKKTFEQILRFVSRVNDKLFQSLENKSTKLIEEGYSCSKDIERADYVAKTLVNTWIQASHAANARNLNFIAVLQPVSFIGPADNQNIDLNHPNNIALKKQFEVVYPLILKYANSSGLNFFDATEIFNNCSSCYFDFCHVGPEGNKIIAQWFSDKLNQL